MIKQVLAALTITGLVACGEQEETSLLTEVAGLVVGSTGSAPAPRQASVSEEELLGNPGKYMRVNIRDLGIWDTLVVAGTNGSRTTWIGGLGTSVTVDGAVVVATRGLPRDLMGADAGQTIQSIQSGGGSATRVHDLLDDQDNIVQFTMDCMIEIKGVDQVNRLGQSIPAIRFEELCRSENLTLTNVYWMDASRKIVRSLQAVSPDAGYLQIDVF